MRTNSIIFRAFFYWLVVQIALSSDRLSSGQELVFENLIKISGRVVDDQTGKPITKMMIQDGRIDPKDPRKVTWGYGSSTISSEKGEFQTNIRWPEGWNARIVVDGYLPQPIISKPPGKDTRELELVVRLKRGKSVLGRIVNHEGKPVVDAKVYAVSPRGLNLYGGNAHESYGDKIDARASYVTTDENGRFELFPGGAENLAISAKSFDVWAVKLKADVKQPLEIKLPAPAKLKISVDIKGAEEETVVFYQLLNHLMDGFKGVESIRYLKVKNGGSLDVSTLPPGKYQFCRSRQYSYGSIGRTELLDRTFVELEPGKSNEIRFVRKNGKRVMGVVEWPDAKDLAGVILKVESIDPVPILWGKYKYATTYDSQLIAGKPQQNEIKVKRMAFTTEALAPGKYRIQVVAYSALTPEERLLTGFKKPDYSVSKTVTVTEKSAPDMLVIELK